MKTIEEIKKVVATRLGYKVHTYKLPDNSPGGENNLNSYSVFFIEGIWCKWAPEKGGQALTDLLVNLGYEQSRELHELLKYKIRPIVAGVVWGRGIGWGLWFQAEKNAETILRAIWEIIK